MADLCISLVIISNFSKNRDFPKISFFHRTSAVCPIWISSTVISSVIFSSHNFFLRFYNFFFASLFLTFFPSANQRAYRDVTAKGKKFGERKKCGQIKLLASLVRTTFIKSYRKIYFQKLEKNLKMNKRRS